MVNTSPVDRLFTMWNAKQTHVLLGKTLQIAPLHAANTQNQNS